MTQTSETLLKPREKFSFIRRDLGLVAHVAEDERRIWVQLLGSESERQEFKLESLGFIQVPGHRECYVRYNSQLNQYAENFSYDQLIGARKLDNDQVLVSLGL